MFKYRRIEELHFTPPDAPLTIRMSEDFKEVVQITPRHHSVKLHYHAKQFDYFFVYCLDHWVSSLNCGPVSEIEPK